MPLSEDTKTPNVYQLEVRELMNDENKGERAVCKTTEFIGLSQTELEKYRSNPFWKKLRCAMFVLFWVLWLAMFLGAILLIIFSPKCTIVQEPDWWRKHVSYQIFTPTFFDSNGDGIGDFSGIRLMIEKVRRTGIKTILVSPVLSIEKDDFVSYDVIDFDNVDERFGTINDLKSLIDETHDGDIHFTMALPISATSASHKWFESAKTGGDYKDYYVWKKADDVKDDPNYVVEKDNESAYLTYDGKNPVLNWLNTAVHDSIFNVAKTFLNMGVDGFYLGRVDQSIKHLSKSEGDTVLSMIHNFIGSVRDYRKDNVTCSGREIAVFSSLSDFTDIQEFNSSALLNLAYVADDTVTKINNSCPDGVAKCLHSTLLKSLEHFSTKQLPQAWQFTNYLVSRLSSRFDKATAALLTFVQLSLPGAVELSYGQELSLEDSSGPADKFTGLMQWNNEKHAGFTTSSQKPLLFSTTDNYKEENYEVQYRASRSPLKTVTALAKLHSSKNSFALGETQLAPLIQDVILFSRFEQSENITSGVAYLVGANFGATVTEINGTVALPERYVSINAQVLIVTDNVDHKNYKPRQKIPSLDKVSLGPRQGILIKVDFRVE